MKKNILIIGFVWPEPKSSAAGSRMMQLIAVFQAQEYTVTFATACAKSANAFDLESIGVKTAAIAINSASFDTFISTLNPEIVMFDRFNVEEQFGWRVAEQCPKALRVLDTEDLHSLRRGRHQAYKDNAEFNTHYLFNDTAKREIASIYRCDLTLVISEAEMTLLKEQFKVDERLLLYLPFMLDSVSVAAQQQLPSYSKRKHFVTIGNFLHEPNYNSILYLKESIWPLIKQQLPAAEMHIYGAYATQKVTQLHNEKEGFLITGFAENVATVMQNAKVCLAPLRFGAGLKGKIVDAMVSGTPCVTTTVGAEGLFGNLNPNAFIEDTPNAFANKAIELYSTEFIWNTFQNNGFEVVNQRFNKLHFGALLVRRLKSLITDLESHRLHNFTGQLLMHHTLQSTKFMSKWIEAKNRKD
ncbi:glycosyltransferase family 4 protein [Bizionia gelidisalsuginis]|uniref:Glycosyltransferase family 4 protein n=1 Tax=Bizionia gelidisalsuginis TaxID=291188 RepID=A0ABY3ME80_9FLAO|nr:glycosyltransferase [Bizionia gelidisalsuginis]TYC17917.1 glycosyltransferase family 4 protein [Bizionia gelidisalsuginis]